MCFQRAFYPFKEQGEVLLLRFANDLEDFAKVDQLPVLEGKRMIIQLSPKKKETAKKNTGDSSSKQETTDAAGTESKE